MTIVSRNDTNMSTICRGVGILAVRYIHAVLFSFSCR